MNARGIGLEFAAEWTGPADAKPAVITGIAWGSPHRPGFFEPLPTDPVAHAECVESALAWLRSSPLSWLEPLAEGVGLPLWTDGSRLFVVAPVAAPVARGLLIPIGVWGDASTFLPLPSELQ